MAEQVQQVVEEGGRTMSEFLRMAIRLYMEEREWLRRVESRKASCRLSTLSPDPPPTSSGVSGVYCVLRMFELAAVLLGQRSASPSRRAISTTAFGNSRLTEPFGRLTRAPRAGPSRHDRSPVERGHDADARALRACHKVGISDIEAMHLAQLDSPLEERTVNDADGTECQVGLEFGCLRTFLTLPW